eukprot:CAMPEP_0201281260 /NCGR_PEP_ID=MMETSP1317-20130820/2083_1 /ASSEMBLY_ACC=CAM_ASM_000770 /TAXON_ID=187299 /ORGANISM="Undescribed Undescribed, Strain Undescribed" /LENGTH=86 /DNA_ID=CAMNT_0047590635 /DNA_START=47 /DNA_END=307 /DNA_ORIENTATION=+
MAGLNEERKLECKEVFSALEEGGTFQSSNIGLALRAAGCILSEQEVREIQAHHGKPVVTFPEFLAMVERARRPGEQELLEAFRMLD